jgi:hypothetical protein
LIPFSAEARRQFDPVAVTYGLSCAIAEEHRVRYEGSETFLHVNFDNGRSYELGVELGQKISGKVERPFSLAEVLRLRRVPEAVKVDGLLAASPAALADELGLLAQLTMANAPDFLRGSDLSFAQVAKLRETESGAYASRATFARHGRGPKMRGRPKTSLRSSRRLSP